MIRQPPSSTLFPSTTLFRSARRVLRRGRDRLRPRRRPLPQRLARQGRQETHARRRLPPPVRSEEHTSELQSRQYLVCRLLLEKKQLSSRLTPIAPILSPSLP